MPLPSLGTLYFHWSWYDPRRIYQPQGSSSLLPWGISQVPGVMGVRGGGVIQLAHRVQVHSLCLAASPSQCSVGYDLPFGVVGSLQLAHGVRPLGPLGLQGTRSTWLSAAGVSCQGCYPVSSLITLRYSLLNEETPIIWVIKHFFEFSPGPAVIITIKRTSHMKAFIPAAQSSQ